MGKSLRLIIQQANIFYGLYFVLFSQPLSLKIKINSAKLMVIRIMPDSKVKIFGVFLMRTPVVPSPFIPNLI